MNNAKQTKAENERLLKALAELANARDKEAIKRFVGRYPDFIGKQVYRGVPVLRDEKAAVVAGAVCGLAVWHLQRAWSGGADANDAFDWLLFYPTTRFVESVDRGRGNIPEEEVSLEERKEFPFPVRVDVARRQIIYKPETPLQTACYWLLQHADKGKVCANADCPAPYFIARKTIQRYCSPDCLKLAQRQWSLDWYNRVGKFQRAGRAKSNSKAKGRKHDGRNR